MSGGKINKNVERKFLQIKKKDGWLRKMNRRWERRKSWEILQERR